MLISDFAIRRPVVTIVTMLALSVFGLIALFQVKTDEFPDVQPPFVLVGLIYPGASPDGVEREVLEPVEEAIAAISGVKKMQGTAQDGYGQIVIEFQFEKTLLEATSRDTVRSRSWTGKPCRMLRNEWTEAWEAEGNPKPLGMPMQFMVTSNAVQRGHLYPEQAKDVNFNPVGQIVGRMNKMRPTREVVFDLVSECIDATERLQGLMNSTTEASA